MTENEKQIEKTDDLNLKTPYSRPQLVVYGDIKEITLARSAMAKRVIMQGAGSNLNMTGFSAPNPDPDPQGSKIIAC